VPSTAGAVVAQSQIQRNNAAPELTL
jgi:hypothetical protein